MFRSKSVSRRDSISIIVPGHVLVLPNCLRHGQVTRTTDHIDLHDKKPSPPM